MCMTLILHFNVGVITLVGLNAFIKLGKCAAPCSMAASAMISNVQGQRPPAAALNKSTLSGPTWHAGALLLDCAGHGEIGWHIR